MGLGFREVISAEEMAVLRERNIAIMIMIRAYMREQNITAKEVSYAVGTSNQTVENWRTNNEWPSLQMQGELCKLFGCTFRQLHGDFAPEESERDAYRDEQALRA